MLTVIGVAALALICWAVLWSVVRLLIGSSNREDRYLDLQAEISEAQVRRRRDNYKVLNQIGAPECPDGTYSPRQVALWQDYNSRAKHDRRQTRREQNALVETRGYLPDEIADIIEGKR